MYNVDSKRSYSLSHHRQHREKRRLLYFCYDVSFYVIWSMGLRKMSNIMNLSNLCTIHLKEFLRKMSCKTFRMLWVIQDYFFLLLRCISYWKLDLNVGSIGRGHKRERERENSQLIWSQICKYLLIIEKIAQLWWPRKDSSY